MNRLSCLAAALLMAAPLPALCDEAAIASGIYAMLQDTSGGAALPDDLAETALAACRNSPALVYPDGLILGLRPNAMDSIQAGGPFFHPAGAMRCAALSGAGVACRNFEGESLTEAAPLTAAFSTPDGATWRIAVQGRDFALLLVPCDRAIFDVTLPDGRNVLAEMTARDDGGPALSLPSN
jgi:hypothetical protein